MNQQRRHFLRRIMQTAWYAYRNRHIPGCNVRTFADALRNAWGFLKAKAQPVVQGVHLRLTSMVQSPIRRSLTGPYASRRAGELGYVTSMMGR
jgi:hypothetical protein